MNFFFANFENAWTPFQSSPPVSLPAYQPPINWRKTTPQVDQFSIKRNSITALKRLSWVGDSGGDEYIMNLLINEQKKGGQMRGMGVNCGVQNYYMGRSDAHFVRRNSAKIAGAKVRNGNGSKGKGGEYWWEPMDKPIRGGGEGGGGKPIKFSG